MRLPEAHLVLADGTRFPGFAVGAERTGVGEAVFTTGMTGYQEVLSDASYCGQIVTMTAPQIGNTGANAADQETTSPFVSGFVVRDMTMTPSSWRAEESLPAYLKRFGIPALTGVDTRALTRHIRDRGAQMAAFGVEAPDTLCDIARAAPPMEGRDLTGEVTTPKPFAWSEGTGAWALATPAPAALHVVAYDFGMKRNILRCLVDAGCRVTVVPARTSAEEALALAPDGIFLSNGPGDPAAATYAHRTVQGLLGKRPIFGICLGHQILSLALGARSRKLLFGHRGLNQPVKDLSTGRVEITTQNHGFVIEPESLGRGAAVSHVHLNDGTCEGIAHPDASAFSVQYHPEAAAGPHDSRHLFGRFVDLMRARSGA